jgi:uncharacterized Zn-finger protein
MADDDYAKFKNDQGVPEIRIGVKEFKCVGASPPQDHPHIYLEMGSILRWVPGIGSCVPIAGRRSATIPGLV